MESLQKRLGASYGVAPLMFFREERKNAPVHRDVLKTPQKPLIVARLIGGDEVNFAIVPSTQDFLAPLGAVFFLNGEKIICCNAQ